MVYLFRAKDAPIRFSARHRLEGKGTPAGLSSMVRPGFCASLSRWLDSFSWWRRKSSLTCRAGIYPVLCTTFGHFIGLHDELEAVMSAAADGAWCLWCRVHYLLFMWGWSRRSERPPPRRGSRCIRVHRPGFLIQSLYAKIIATKRSFNRTFL